MAHWLLVCLCLLSMTAFASHYTGTYSGDDGGTIQLTHDAQGRFTGRWHAQLGTFDLSGQAFGDEGGEGIVEVGSDRLAFDIELSTDGATLTLVLRSNGARFVFSRQSHEVSGAASDQDSVQPRTEATDTYVGSYRGEDIAVVLEGGGGRYTGRIEASGQAYPLQLEASGQQLAGTFQVGQDRFDVMMALQGEKLVVRTGSATYDLVREDADSDSSDASSRDLDGAPDTEDLRDVTITDETGFDEPMTALTLMMPRDWETGGGVLWNPALSCVLAPQAYFASASADETFRIATIAQESWLSANFPTEPVPDGCMAADTGGVRGYVHAWMARERPGARVLGYRDLPERAAYYRALEVNDPASGLRIWVEAGEITYAFVHLGAAVQERLAAVVIMVESFHVSVDGRRLGYLAGSSFGMVIRAPEGELDTFAARATTLLGRVRIDPAWQAAITEGMKEIPSPMHAITMEANAYAFNLTTQAQSAPRQPPSSD